MGKTVTSLDNVCYSIRESFFKPHNPPHTSQWRAPASGKESDRMFLKSVGQGNKMESPLC